MELEKQIISEKNWHYYIHTIDGKNVITELEKIITEQYEKNINKVSLFVPKDLEKHCEKLAFTKQAEIKGYFNGIKPIVCYSSFINKRDSIISPPENNVIRNIINSATKSTYKVGQFNLDNRFSINFISGKDIKMVHDFLNYLFEAPKLRDISLTQLDNNIKNKSIAGLFYNNQLIVCSSLLINKKTGTASIQDIHYNKNYKSVNYIIPVIDKLVSSLAETNIKTIYTLTSALDPERNRLFGLYGFTHGGILSNETVKNGSSENVNVWFKNIKRNGNLR